MGLAMRVIALACLSLCVTTTALASSLLSYPMPTDEALLAQAIERAESPCDDPIYVKLLEKSLDEMSEREYEYFVRKDKECDEYRRRVGASESSADQRPAAVTTSQAQGSGMSSGAVIAISILGTIAALVVIGALAS